MKILYIADYGLPPTVQCAKTQRNVDATIEGEQNYPHLYSNYDFRVCARRRPPHSVLYYMYQPDCRH
jgi:hypothetical protein